MDIEKSSSAEAPATQHRGWKAMPYIIGNETFEKLGATGASANMLVYLISVFHMHSVTATTLLNVGGGFLNLAPLFGAFLSDTYFGRYWTIAGASISSLLGMIILALTSGVSSLHPPPCDQGSQCASITPWQLTVLIVSFALLAIGSGGIKPCNLAFGADQFNPNSESGKKGISSFFNWYYFTLGFAVMVSSTVTVYIQSDVSWTLGLSLPAVFMFFSCAFFFIGTKIYVIVTPEGSSPYTGIVQVLVAAFKKRRLKLPKDPIQSLFDPPHVSTVNSKLPHTQQFRFLDNAALIEAADDIKFNATSAKNPWRLCTLQQVEEVKCLLRITPIWSAGLILGIGISQVGMYATFQALQSDRRLKGSFQIPAGSFSIFSMLAMSIFLPIYDRIIVPWVEKYTGKVGGITLLQRMGIGLILSIIALIISGSVEVQRRNYALNHPTVGIAPGGGAVSSLSSLWLIPQLAVCGLVEAFNTISQIEFYYQQFPETMRSIAGALIFVSFSIGSYLSGFLVTIVHMTTGRDGKENWLAQDLNKGRLDYFYFLVAAMGALNFVYFIVCAKWYRYKEPDNSSPEVAPEISEG